MQMSDPVAAPLTLPCGAVLKNRIAKAAMSENMADSNFNPAPHFAVLYQRWSNGGAGLLITGNVMCDGSALGEAHNVVVEKNHADMENLKKWVQAGTVAGNHLWMQINHPGRQSPKSLSPVPVGPSAIPLKPPLDKAFNCPRELSEAEILEIINRFADTAEIAKTAGFTGVEIHAAHGYLVAQFLSPLSNRRQDRWGGSIENRMRFLLEIYRAIRGRVGNSFPIGVKLNSADFQRGGFSEDESEVVIQALCQEGVDLIEISGGSYESQVMMKGSQRTSTLDREAYFLDFAKKIRKNLKAPLMITGGFRTGKAMRQALAENNLDLIGLGRALALDPAFPRKILKDQSAQSAVRPLTTGVPFFDRLLPLEIVWYNQQIHRMSRGLEPDPKSSTRKVAFRYIWNSMVGI